MCLAIVEGLLKVFGGFNSGLMPMVVTTSLEQHSGLWEMWAALDISGARPKLRVEVEDDATGLV